MSPTATAVSAVTVPARPRRRTRVRIPRRHGSSPLLRNGHLLTMSSVAAAALGGLFRVIATARYSPASVGRSHAVISTVTLLAGIGQLNLADVLVRFVPTSGAHTRRLVLRCYAEGLSKAAVPRHSGSRRGLSSERRHPTSTLPRTAAGARPPGLRALCTGLSATVLGYAAGRIRQRAAGPDTSAADGPAARASLLRTSDAVVHRILPGSPR